MKYKGRDFIPIGTSTWQVYYKKEMVFFGTLSDCKAYVDIKFRQAADYSTEGV